MRYIKLLGIFLRLSAINELQYRANFLLELVNSAVALGTGLAALHLVFYHTDNLGGWTAPELLIVMGVYTFLVGVINLFIQPSMGRLMGAIHDGTFDFTALKPADAQFMSSLTEIHIWKAVDLVLGALVIGIGLAQTQSSLAVGDAVAFAVTLVAGGAMIYSLWLILTTTAFWFVRIWALLDLFQQITQTGRWPVGLYPAWLRTLLTFLIPVAFAITVPAQALAGRLDLRTMLVALGAALVMLALARAFWRVGLRRYTGASA